MNNYRSLIYILVISLLLIGSTLQVEENKEVNKRLYGITDSLTFKMILLKPPQTENRKSNQKLKKAKEEIKSFVKFLKFAIRSLSNIYFNSSI